eukprot:6488725-Amphidinium_carterae.1
MPVQFWQYANGRPRCADSKLPERILCLLSAASRSCVRDKEGLCPGASPPEQRQQHRSRAPKAFPHPVGPKQSATQWAQSRTSCARCRG